MLGAPQAQGFLHAMGGDRHQLADTLLSQGTLLAAHGPYTAAGVSETLGIPVEVRPHVLALC